MTRRSATRQTTQAMEAITERVPTMPHGAPGSREQIARVVAAIAERFQPARIVLFGSRAYGVPTSESDVDLMVIMETPLQPGEQARAIHASIEPRPHFQLDLHVRTPAQVRLGLREHDFFILDVMRGITLYEGKGGDLAPHDEDGSAKPSGLKQATQEWLGKADENERVSTALLNSDLMVFDAVCFHAQQCVELLLKAFLQENEIRWPRTHDLVALAQLCLPIAPELARLESDLKWLSECAVEPRYPGLNIKPAEATRSVQAMNAARTIILPALGLPPG